MIVITDGECTHSYLDDLYLNAAALRGRGGGGAREERQVWGIGVGDFDEQELRNISGDWSRVLKIGDYRRIDEIKQVFEMVQLVRSVY